MDGRIIHSRVKFRRVEQEEFKEIDFVVMGVAFKIQNEMGRLFSESVYRNELKNRLRHEFDNVECDVPLTIGFEGFSKTYKADLVVESKAIFELKAVERTVSQHRLQLSQYLFLTDLKHGKLINFSSPKVTGEYVSTTLDTQERKRLSFDTERFDESDASAVRLKTLMTNLLESWGGFLNLELYYQATEYLLRETRPVVRPNSVFANGREIGTQKAHLLSDVSAYKITAMTNDTDSYRAELNRFIQHTTLDSILWVNLNRHIITFETVMRNGFRKEE